MEYLTKRSKDEEIEKHWLKIKEAFRFEYQSLNEKDLIYEQGEFSKMLDRIGRKLGWTDSQLRRKILKWEESASHYF